MARPAPRFVVHEHHASRLHFDVRLEAGGTLKSWAVPKGPSLDPAQKRLAVEVEDHALGYIGFEGRIAEGRYGAGDVVIWDRGTYDSLGADPLEALRRGRFRFVLHGEKLRGAFSLVRMKRGEGQWLLIKSDDEHAEPGWEIETVLDPGTSGPKKAKRRAPAKRPMKEKPAAPPSDPPAEAVPAAALFAADGLEGDATVTADGHAVALTSLGRVYFPEAGLTKGDLLRYYHRVAPVLLPYLRDRPLILKRYPQGVGGPHFFQHEAGDVPPFVRTARFAAESGRAIDYVVCDDEATLLYLANLGAIERHPWHARVASPDEPDWIVWDLDPGEGVPFEVLCRLALAVRDVLAGLGLRSYAKTSGSRGLHVYAPVANEHPFAVVAPFAERVARAVVAAHPALTTLERAPAERPAGTVYVDHLQNARGKTVVAPYSARARPGATVSTPLTWAEVEAVPDPRAFTIETVPGRLAEVGDPFAPVLTDRQGLAEALSAAARMPA